MIYGTILGALFFATGALAQPSEISSPGAFDTQVVDAAAPVLLALCRDAAQCTAAEQALKSAEADKDVVAANAAAAKANIPALKFAFASTANLPELASGWDEQDRAVCLQDASKKEEQCKALEYPVFILKNGTQHSDKQTISAGVEELARGQVSQQALVGMAIHAYEQAGLVL